MVGRFTPSQRTIVQREAKLDTKLHVDLITWFCHVSGHHAFGGIIPPQECPQPTLLQDKPNKSNEDEEQDPEVENMEFDDGTYTFTSAHNLT